MDKILTQSFCNEICCSPQQTNCCQTYIYFLVLSTVCASDCYAAELIQENILNREVSQISYIGIKKKSESSSLWTEYLMDQKKQAHCYGANFENGSIDQSIWLSNAPYL